MSVARDGYRDLELPVKLLRERRRDFKMRSSCKRRERSFRHRKTQVPKRHLSRPPLQGPEACYAHCQVEARCVAGGSGGTCNIWSDCLCAPVVFAWPCRIWVRGTVITNHSYRAFRTDEYQFYHLLSSDPHAALPTPSIRCCAFVHHCF